MDEKTAKGFGLGCLASVVLLGAGVFLFTALCGVLFKGCLQAVGMYADEDALMCADDADFGPEEPGRFEKVWVGGSRERLAPKVLRICLSGPLSLAQGAHSVWTGEDEQSAAAALRRIRAATSDTAIAGILLEIDSPGGGVTTADVLYDALMRYRRQDTNRFVVVHMGDLCCSGGYYIAAAADSIWAHPTTMTGSIGVVLNGFNVAELARKLGVRDVTIASGVHKDLLNPLKDVNPAHVALLREPIDEMHARFVELVAAGRKLPVSRVRTLADGRVFSASVARKNGLVDGIGHKPDVYAALSAFTQGEAVRLVRYRDKASWGGLLDAFFILPQACARVRTWVDEVSAAHVPRVEYRLR